MRVEIIINVKPQNNTKEVRAFIGIFNYCRGMWAKLSHLLHPLTALTSHKVRFKWTDVEQTEFDDIKCSVSQDTVLVY